jgi:hypothetical protein
MSTAKKDYKRITTKSLIDMKMNGEKISMLTAYDFTMAKIVDSAGVDVILVAFIETRGRRPAIHNYCSYIDWDLDNSYNFFF